MNETQKKILALKKEKNALILAHYYQTTDVREVADHVCDSFEMAQRARDASENILIICGVQFMAESAKILNPGKTVLLPTPDAGCPMADMITPDDVTALRAKYPEAAVVCYVNSSAAVKAVSDICCTSSSAEKIVRSLPQRQVIFVPDKNLGSFVASRLPEKEIILFDGCCPIHDAATEADILAAKAAHPGAKFFAHPECRAEVVKHADYTGSTAGIIARALESDCEEIIIGTESEIIDRLAALAPNKSFYPLTKTFICQDMKKTRPADILNSLENGEFEVTLEPGELEAARASLERMVAVG